MLENFQYLDLPKRCHRHPFLLVVHQNPFKATTEPVALWMALCASINAGDITRTKGQTQKFPLRAWQLFHRALAFHTR
jgi:hypothetical protein